MNNPTKNRPIKAGLPPGSLVHIGKHKSEKVKLTVIDYNDSELSENEYKTVEECFVFRDKETISWINIDGLHDTNAIAELGNHFGLHPLLLEDVLNTKHRPKAEVFDDHIFLTLKMLGIGKDQKSIVSEQVSFVLGKTWIISFQEVSGDIFDTIRQNMREKKGYVRKNGADYLLYRLVDTIVDNYFYVIENIGETTENLEENILQTANNEILRDIQEFKKQLINLRKAANPLREAILILKKEDSLLIQKTTTRYLQDVYEHIIHINESLETQRDMLLGIRDLYLSSISNKMNQIMQVLTVISTIFIPLTFITGLYGMNFDFMPELHWRYGYFVAWGIMLAIVVIMMSYFKRKKWY